MLKFLGTATRIFSPSGKLRPYLQGRLGIVRIHPRSELFYNKPPDDLEPGESPACADEPEGAAPEPKPALEPSPAMLRFTSCRWRKAAENGSPEHCTHRDVQPMAGTAGFSADSWLSTAATTKSGATPGSAPSRRPKTATTSPRAKRGPGSWFASR